MEEEVGGGWEDAAAAEFEIDESAGGELDVADGFGRDAEAGGGPRASRRFLASFSRRIDLCFESCW